MKKLKCAVVGAGYLGKFHAQKYASLPDCELVAVVDVDGAVANSVAADSGAMAFTDYRQILDKVDAVSIVVPTTYHHAVAKDFLEAGVHVLVEKPITVTVAEADDLIAIAKKNNLVLQVGHLERFNPAVLGLDKEEKPLFIESHRLSPFNPRANDVSVVLDLMIHDIDIILALVDSELERKMRMFRPSSYVSVDFQNRVLTKHKTGTKEMFPGIPEIVTEESTFESGDALLEEIKHFVDCIKNDKNPLVSGEAGRRALETAIKITQLLGEKL